VTDPYNLYFTPDGGTAVVVAERYQRLDLRDPVSWQLVASIAVGRAGVDHGDFSADGRFFYVSCEWSGFVAKVDLVERRVVAEAKAGTQPIDVRLAPDAGVLYVADQARNGVIVLDPGDLHEIGFLPTGRGAHGLYLSRDTTQLYVSNRLGGSVSVIDLATRQVTATWTIPGGGSPDMGGVSVDGSQLWLSGRYHGEVYVFDTRSGALVQRIRTGASPHGLAYFPQPGRFSLGHTGVYR
jgi:YVTN family beta-propeller protein